MRSRPKVVPLIKWDTLTAVGGLTKVSGLYVDFLSVVRARSTANHKQLTRLQTRGTKKIHVADDQTMYTASQKTRAVESRTRVFARSSRGNGDENEWRRRGRRGRARVRVLEQQTFLAHCHKQTPIDVQFQRSSYHPR